MKKAKDEGKNVKFIGKKLFIEGNEYVGATSTADPTTGPPPMDY